MDIILIILVLMFIIGILIYGLIYTQKMIKIGNKRKQDFEKYKNNLNKRFKIDKYFLDINNVHAFLLNDKNKKVIYYNIVNKKEYILNYKDLIEFQLIENGNSVIKGRIGSALIGAAVLGGVGAIIGSAGSRKITTHVYSLYLNLVFNNLEINQINLQMLNVQCKNNTLKYIKAKNKAMEIVSLLKYVQHNA